jgi:hypothetical protein
VMLSQKGPPYRTHAEVEGSVGQRAPARALPDLLRDVGVQRCGARSKCRGFAKKCKLLKLFDFYANWYGHGEPPGVPHSMTVS